MRQFAAGDLASSGDAGQVVRDRMGFWSAVADDQFAADDLEARQPRVVDVDRLGGRAGQPPGRGRPGRWKDLPLAL